MPRPMNFDQLYPGRFLKAGHFEQPRTLQIRDVEHEELHGDKGPQIKVIVHFSDEKLSLVACKTNGLCFREMFGDHVPDWFGKRIALFAGEWAGEPCVRVWGSPDIERDIDCVIALPRKKPFTMKLRALGKAAPKQQADAPARRPIVDTYVGLMKAAESKADIDNIEDKLAKDNGLTPDETQWLMRQLKRREAQVTGEVAK